VIGGEEFTLTAKGRPMTEAEWLRCEGPTELLALQWDKPNERKLRLLACAIPRRMRHFSEEPCVVAAAEVSERYADGRATVEEMGAAGMTAIALRSKFHEPEASAACRPRGVVGAARQVTRRDAGKVIWEVEQVADRGGVGSRERTNLIRDIFGNPFRPVVFSPSWGTDTAVSLAHTMYESRDFGAMPILAEALQDARCDNADVLNHCRGPGPHVRGCWVVDLVLGKA
jgi:hypothetical protein